MTSLTLRAVVFLSLAVGALAQDAAEIMRRSVERDQNNFARAKDYTYLQRVEERNLDSKGRVKSKEVETFDVTILDGRPYKRLVAKDDRPLSGEEGRKAQEKFDKVLRERQEESAGRRAKREADAGKERREGRRFLAEIPQAFRFRLVGEQEIDGHAAWVIEAEPRPEYKPRARNASILKKFRGKLWIDKAQYDWLRVEAETTGTVSFGWMLARLAKGTRVEFQQMRVNDEVWLPRSVHVRFDARLALLKRINQDVDITFWNYRKFRTDSRVLAVGTGDKPSN